MKDGSILESCCSLAAKQLDCYDTVKMQDIGVTNIQPDNDRFMAQLSDGTQLFARKVLLTTGLLDKLPDIPGFQTFYGRSIFHCPYCDGWEVRTCRSPYMVVERMVQASRKS